jgi:CRP/FNR family transcriptional regulator, anaerobic regulatory protein
MTGLASKTGVAWQLAARQEQEDTGSIECDLERAFGSRSRQLVADRGCEIITAGAACQYVFQLRSGLACRQRLLPEGREAILDLYRPGDFIGLDNLFFAPALDTVLALTTLSYSAIDYAALYQLLQHPNIALQLMQNMAEEKQRVDTIATFLGQLKARERTAALLLFLWRRLRRASGKAATGGNEAGLPFTQKQLANYLGVDVIHLNRVLSRLRNGGALKLRKGVMIINDVTWLEQIAGGAGTLHARSRSVEARQLPMLPTIL